MDQHLIFLLLGLANGAVYAALALALVVTYRSSGVVNFATGAIALLGAYTYAFLRDGQLLLPLPFVPKTVDVGSPLSLWPAILISVAVCAVVGLLLHLLVFRPLRAAPPVAKAVASLGVMVVMTGVFTVRVGSTSVHAAAILPFDIWKVGSVYVSSNRVWFALTVVLMTIVLAAAYRFTRFGLLTRAAAESEKGAFVSGIRPDRLAAVNAMISAAVAGIAGILISPIVPLTPAGFTFFIVPALAAAIIGRFQYMVPAVAAGLAIGMLQSEGVHLAGDYHWLPSVGLSELVPLVLILFALVLRARPLPSRGEVIQQNLGRAPRPVALVRSTVVGAAIATVGLFALTGAYRLALVTSLIFAIISLSLVVVTGFAGQISLAQLTLAGVAGFLLGSLTTDWQMPIIHTSIPFPLAPLLAALAAAAVGVIVGLPALRVRGLPVAVVTLALGVAIEAVWFHNPDYAGSEGKNITGPNLFGIDLRARVAADFPRVQFGLLVLVVLVGVALGVAHLRRSRLGSQMLAVRANERAAAGAGVDVVRVKLIAFALGAFIAGLGGAMLAYLQANVTFASFSALAGLGLFATAYIGGITSVSGGIIAGLLVAGGLLATVSDNLIHLGGDWYAVIAGIGLIIVIIQNPEGVVGPIHTKFERRRNRANEEPLPALDFSESPLHPMDPVAGGEVVLSSHGLTVRYGGVVAVDNVDLEVRNGTIVGLIGPNGAGKTTILDALSGFAPYSGTIALAGEEITSLAPHKRVRAGLGRTFQQTQLYDDMSVAENVSVGVAGIGPREPRPMNEVLELLGIADVAERPVGQLSQGRRQLVAIGRALIASPDVLLLDEPAGGLDTGESQWLGQRLRHLRDAGVTIVLIDHDMHLVLNLCDNIYVLDFGRVIAHGLPSTIRVDRTVAAAYLGETHAEAAAQ
jgi:ABC-type branched-subunit amino acid transport system ATPase component/branched-subunit amino acid ABC-type transport system permease component